jgi:putative DNA primase/helicase
MISNTLSEIAARLGGKVNSGQVLCPGPGHSAHDRSLCVKLDSKAPDGFIVHSFSGDDPIVCKDHVRSKLGLPAFEPNKGNGSGKAWTQISEHVYRNENGEQYLRVRKCLDENGRKQYPQARWDGSSWVSGKPPGAKLPYHLPELIAAPASTTIFIAEGEQCVEALARLGFVATTNSEGADDGKGKKWSPDLNKWFEGRKIILIGDNDAPGRAHVEHVAANLHTVAESVQVLDLAPHWPGEPMPEGFDVADWIEQHDRAGSRLAQLATKAPLWEPGPAQENDEIKRLAKLGRIEYDRARKNAAKQLGVTTAALDEVVAERRKEHKEEGTPSAWPHWDVDPWSESVDSERLLKAITERIRKYVMLTADQAVVVALWIIFTWVHDKAAVHSPILLVTSPEPNCGKSTLLGVISFLVRRSLVSVSIKGPALFRSIEKWHPTFIVDEADTSLVNNVDLKEVVNSGWTRGQSVVRCDPDTLEPAPFSTFAPKAIGMKGRNLPDTTLSRAITIEMQRKLPGEKVADFFHLDDADLKELRCKLSRWAEDNSEQLAAAVPAIPDGFHNRVRANWKLLLAIAELTGSAEKARQAATAIENIQATFEASIGVELLHGIRKAFEAAPGKETIFTRDLISWLVAEPERPWASYGRARLPITDRQIAKLLREHRITSDQLRVGEVTAKGYKRERFTEAWQRYPKPEDKPEAKSEDAEGAQPTPKEGSEQGKMISLRPNSGFQPSQRHNADGMGTSDVFPSVTESVCDAHEKRKLFNNDGHCDGVTLRNPESAREGEIDHPSRPTPNPPADRICAQCNGAPDGKEQRVSLAGATVWLHPECRRFYAAGHRTEGRAG